MTFDVRSDQPTGMLPDDRSPAALPEGIVTGRPGRARATMNLLAVIVVAGLAFAAAGYVLKVAPPRQASPDDALYASYASRWLAGQPLQTMSGEAATVRAPGYPVTLAVAMIPVHQWSNAERIIGAAAIAIVILSSAGIAAVIAGPFGAIAAAILLTLPGIVLAAGRSAIDGQETALVLAAILAGMWASRRGWPMVGAVLVGALLAGAILTKETALALAPLPLLWAAVVPVDERGRAIRWGGLATLATLMLILPWWLWVYRETGWFFPTRLGGTAAVVGLALLGAGAIVGLLFAMGPVGRRVARVTGAVPSTVRWWLAVSIAIAWTLTVFVAFFVADPRFGSESRPSVSELVRSFERLGALLVWPLGGVLVVVGGIVFATGDRPRLRGLMLATILLSGIAGIVVVKAWDPRSSTMLAVLVNLGIALGLVAVATATYDYVRHRQARLAGVLGATALLVAALATNALGLAMAARFPEGFAPVLDWNNRAVRDVATWLEKHAEPGDTIVSSWQFAAGIDAATGASFRILQTPTLQLRIGGPDEAPMVATGALFREHGVVPDVAPTDWLFLRRHPTEGYYVGLGAADTLSTIADPSVRYLIVTGEHFAQSTTTIVSSLLEWPGLTDVARFADGGAEIIVLAIDHAALAQAPSPLQMNTPTLRYWPIDAERARPDDEPGDVLVEVLAGRELEVAPDDATGWELANDLLGEP